MFNFLNGFCKISAVKRFNNNNIAMPAGMSFESGGSSALAEQKQHFLQINFVFPGVLVSLWQKKGALFNKALQQNIRWNEKVLM